MKIITRSAAEERVYEMLVEVARGETYTITDDVTGEALARLEPTGSSEELANEIAREFGVGDSRA